MRANRPLEEITRANLHADLRLVRDKLPPQPVRDALPNEVEVPLAEMCDRARLLGLRVEQLLVQVKQVWRELPGSQRFESHTHRDERLDRIVTALITKYYDDGGRRGA
jgi:hypothetical protein